MGFLLGNRLSGMEALSEHVSAHYEGSVFTCDSCDFDTEDMDELNTHILKVLSLIWRTV